MMPLLNYTTTIEAAKTANEIQGILAKHGARAVLIEYDVNGLVTALSFKARTVHGDVAIRLPIEPDNVLRVMGRQAIPRHFVNRPQAIRVAWRILKDWVEAQMAILETEMVKMEQIFLPYVTSSDGRTLYDRMVDAKFQLPEGRMKDAEYKEMP